MGGGAAEGGFGVGEGGTRILLIKKGEHFEAVIKDEVICTNATKNLCGTLLCVETSWQKHVEKENFCAAGSCCEEMKT